MTTDVWQKSKQVTGRSTLTAPLILFRPLNQDRDSLALRRSVIVRRNWVEGLPSRSHPPYLETFHMPQVLYRVGDDG